MSSLVQSPAIAWTAGLGAAAVLIVLHLLRARSRRVVVATTVFWSTVAAQPQRRRELWGRLSYLRTLALLLVIVAALAVALSGLRRPLDEEAHVVIVDVGRSMGIARADGSLPIDDAIRQVITDLDTAAGPLAVIAASASPTIVGRFDDPTAVTRRALASIQAEARVSSLTQSFRLAASLLSGSPDARVTVYSDRAVPADVIPSHLAGRMAIRSIRPGVDRGGIVGITYQAGQADDGVLNVNARRVGDRPVSVRLSIGDTVRQAEADAHGTATFDRVAPSTQLSVALVAADGSEVDRTTLRTPELIEPSFRVSDRTPAALQVALASIGSINDAADDAIAVLSVANAEEIPTDDRPRIVVIDSPAGEANANLSVRFAADRLTDGLSLEDRFVTAGSFISTVNVGSHALILDEADQVLAALRGRRTLVLSASLFDDRATVSRSPGLMLLIERFARSMHDGVAPVIAIDDARASADPAWQMPPGRRQGTALLSAVDPLAEADRGSDIADGRDQISFSQRLEWWMAALAVAAVALAIESVLSITRRIA